MKKSRFLFTWMMIRAGLCHVMVVFFAKQSGFSPDWRVPVLELWEASFEGKTTHPYLQHLVAGACFPRARPRMYRREVWVAALNLIEAHWHSHTLCSFRRIRSGQVYYSAEV
jgi:hypothetical protein